jgi:hypothetical protein
MKKLFLLLALSIVFYSCKHSEENSMEENSTVPVTEKIEAQKENLYQGDFIFVADAAVLKGKDFIYGVVINDKATELAEKIKPIQETEFDMVEVVVKGTINPKPEEQEGWDELITIEEIIKVSDTPSKIDIKLEDSKE